MESNRTNFSNVCWSEIELLFSKETKAKRSKQSHSASIYVSQLSILSHVGDIYRNYLKIEQAQSNITYSFGDLTMEGINFVKKKQKLK